MKTSCKPGEIYNICTGKSFSIKDFIKETVKCLKLKTKWVGSGLNTRLINLETKKTIIKINPNLFRPAEVSYLKGNFSKANKKLKWSPKTNLKKLVKIMVSDELKYYNY